MKPAPNKIDPNQVKKFDKDKLKAVQMDLKTKGHYKGKIDGVYGKQTENAILGYNYNQVVAERNLPEMEVVAPRRHKLAGCVEGVCFDIADKNEIPLEKLRKSNNLFGDAWNLLDTAYGEEINISDGNFSNLKVNDLVALSRKEFPSDKIRGIPEKEQHVGRISKIENGVPYVRHYIGNRGRDSKGEVYGEFLEEPINNISKFAKYTPSRVKRLADFKDITFEDPSFKFDAPYKPNQIEKEFVQGVQDKKKLQKVLGLDSKEFDDLTKIAYGIMGAESSFGRSERTLYRMATPDFLQKGVKVAHDLLRGVDVYDDNINNLSQGYSSTKESSLHGVSSNDGSSNYKESNKKVRSGDYKDLERTNNYMYYKLQELGLNPDNLESGDASYKAILTNLSWLKKRNPNATEEDLLRAYTGKKDISTYKKTYDQYVKTVDPSSKYDYKYTTRTDDLLGTLSSTANTINETLKDAKSKVLGTVRDYSPLPENLNQLVYDVLGGKEEFTEKALSQETKSALKEIVQKNLQAGKNSIEYGDYGTSNQKNEDVGGGKSPSITKMATDPNYILKTLLGQATIQQNEDGTVSIKDTYDFNDKGKSFGILDDVSKRGFSPYSIVRSVGRNLGSQDGQGSPVNITLDLNEMKTKRKQTKGYFTGGEIAMITNYAAGLNNDYISAFTKKEFDPSADPYKINWSKLSTQGVVGMIPEVIKMMKDKKQRESYVPTATPGNYSKGGRIGYAMGGELDEQLSSRAFEVEADPNRIDSKHYPHLNAKLDHGEVVTDNKFVFSNRLKNPQTGETFAEEAEALQKVVGKSERIKKLNPYDAFANNTININNKRTENLAQLQEALATVMGHRNDRPKGMALGGATQGPIYPQLPFGSGDFSRLYPDPGPQPKPGQPYMHLKGDYYYDPYNKSYMWRNPLTGSYKRETGMPGFGQTNKDFRPYFQQKGDVITPLATTINDRDGNPISISKHLSEYPAKVQSQVQDPFDPFVPRDPSIPKVTPPQPQGGSGKGRVKPKATGNPKATTSPLDGQAEYDRAMYEEMQAAANRNLPIKPIYDPETDEILMDPIESSIPRKEPNIAAALNFGKGQDDSTKVMGDEIRNKFTAGDALQALEVASKFGQLIGGADVEMPNFDTTRITKETFDPRNALYQSNRTLQNALNTMEAPSVNMRRNMANSLYAQRLGQDNTILSEYNRMNQGANTQFEQRQSDQRRYNIGQTNYTEDLNQRNKDTYRNAVQNAFTSLGNFGEGLNQKKVGTDALNILKKSYPQVYQRIMETWLEEEKAAKKTKKEE